MNDEELDKIAAVRDEILKAVRDYPIERELIPVVDAIIKAAIEKAIELAFEQQARAGRTPQTIEEIHHKIQAGMAAARLTPEYEQEGRELMKWTAGMDGTLWPMGIFVGEYAQRIADAHNATLKP